MSFDAQTIANDTRIAPAPFVDAAHMPAQRGEIPSLDGFRAFSIVLVMCGHFISGKIFPGGMGVLVFFIISGFLITRLLLNEYKQTNTIRLDQFYIRRLLRLYPVVIVFTLVVATIGFYKIGSVPFGEVSATLFYYSNYYFQYGRGDYLHAFLPVSIFWSLSIEEHFYIVYPLLLLILVRNIRHLVIGMAVVMLLALAFRLMAAAAHPEYLATNYFYFRTEMRMDSLATGALMAALCETSVGRSFLYRAGRAACVAAALAAVAICLLIRDPWFRETLRYSILNIAIAVLIAAVLFSDRYAFVNRVLNKAVVVSIGRLSYSLYVWHLGLNFVIVPLGMPYWVNVVAMFTLSFIAAYLSYNFIEAPFMKLRHRFGSVARQPSILSALAPTRYQQARDYQEGA